MDESDEEIFFVQGVVELQKIYQLHPTASQKKSNDDESDTDFEDGDEEISAKCYQVEHDVGTGAIDVWDEINHGDPLGDIAEVEKFIEDVCCSNNCIQNFSKNEIALYRNESLNFDYSKDGVNVLDTIILSQIRSMYSSSEVVTHARQSTSGERKQNKMNYTLNGATICRSLFMFVHAIKIKRFKRLMNIYKTEGFIEKPHGNYRRLPVNVTSFSSCTEVVNFLRNFAEDHALFMPGQNRSKYTIIKLLPSEETKKSIYEKYTNACEVKKCSAVSYYIFIRIWNQCCIDIKIQLPRSDLCMICQKSNTSKSNLIGLSEEEKMQFFENCMNHLKKVKAERDLYNQLIKKTREDFKKNKLKKSCRGKMPLNSYSGTIHLSFDFAQQLHIPSLPQQPGPLYFLATFKVGVFGISCDTDQSQANFIIPETVTITKGANAIISYLHYYLETFSYGEEHIHLHADNCAGQNKNNYVVAYFAWRIMMGLNKTIKYSFLPTGHTKFSCDWKFGLIKKVLRHTPASSINDLVNIINKSSKTNYAVPTGDEKGQVFVTVYDWIGFFNTKLLKVVPNVTKYSHFNFDSSWMGVVKCQEEICSNDEDVKHVLFSSRTFKKSDHVNEMIPEGLTDERQQYLFEKIRPFCPDETKDVLCPEPLKSLLKEDEPKAQKQLKGSKSKTKKK